MLAIIRWTIWQRRWSVLWWSIGVIAMIALNLAFYPTIRDQASELEKSFSSFSDSTLALFGGTDFFSPVGYLNSQVLYLMLPLLLIILGVGMGNSLLGREESEHTVESLLARPISRSRLLLAKALVGILILFAVTAVGTLAILALAKLVNLGVPLPNVLAACFACFMLVITFSSVAFLLAATGRGRAASLGIATVYAIGGYIIGSLASSVHWLDKPSLIFPYHYYRSADILHGTFAWSSILFFAAFTLGCGILAWASFRRRDLV